MTEPIDTEWVARAARMFDSVVSSVEFITGIRARDLRQGQRGPRTRTDAQAIICWLMSNDGVEDHIIAHCFGSERTASWVAGRRRWVQRTLVHNPTASLTRVLKLVERSIENRENYKNRPIDGELVDLDAWRRARNAS